jgi:hypothetical protein
VGRCPANAANTNSATIPLLQPQLRSYHNVALDIRHSLLLSFTFFIYSIRVERYIVFRSDFFYIRTLDIRRLEYFLSLSFGQIRDTRARPLAMPATMDTSYLSSQVTAIVGQLHTLFDDIGVPSHERDSRESEVCLLLMLS